MEPREDMEPDHPYIREIMASESGDDYTKADLIDLYSEMDREDWY